MSNAKNGKSTGGSPNSAQEGISDDLLRVRALCSEFFDAGIILTTREVNGRTEFHQTSFGNQFAVRGVFEEFADGTFQAE